MAGSKWGAGGLLGGEVHMDRLRVERVPVYRPKPLHRYGGAMPRSEFEAQQARAEHRAKVREAARTAVIAVFTIPVLYLTLVLLLLAGGAR